MIQMEVTFCRIDDRPITNSRAYKLIDWLLGPKVAERLTYTVVIPKDVDGDASRTFVRIEGEH